MTDQVAVSETIAASPELIYGMISDVTRMGEWSPENFKCRWLGGSSGPVVGARFSGSNRGNGRRWSTQCTITSAEAGERFGFHVSFAGVPIADWRYELKAVDGGTEVTEHWTDRRPGWMNKLSKPAMGVGDRPGHNREGMLKTLANLKAAAERSN